MRKLNNKTAIITGGTSGIGLACAKLFVEEGADVILVGRNRDKGVAAENEIRESTNGNAKFFQCDVTKVDNISALYDFVCENYGKLDILVNNAGIFLTDTLETVTFEKFERIYQTNVASAIFMTKTFIDCLKKNKGTIINVASIGGLQSYIKGSKQYLYASSKAALIEFSQYCALNYAPDVRVNCLCPGPTVTPIYLNRDFSRFDGTIPLGRMGKPDDVANAALFLASQDAEYITGAILTVDGGGSLK